MQARPRAADGLGMGFVDESHSFHAGRLVHVLACVEPLSDLDPIREALRLLPPKPPGPLHFRNESGRRRIDVAAAVGRLPMRITVVVCRSEIRVERARGLSVSRLGWLVGHRVSSLTFESRDPRGNAHDRSVLRGMRVHGIEIDCHVAGKEEPILWASDVVAGAVRLALVGGDAEPLRRLGDIEVETL